MPASLTPVPLPPVETIDWDHLGVKITEVNGHVESRYDVRSGNWTRPKFVQDPKLHIHGLAPGLNYGQQLYEGMKAFRHPDGQIAIFRPERHAQRMAHSASFVSVPPIPTSHFVDSVRLAVSLNSAYVPPNGSNASLYIRPLAFGCGAHLGLSPPEEYLFCVYVNPINAYHGTQPVDALILEEFDRAAPHGTGSAKVGGNYAPVMRWSDKAKLAGYGITLHLDSQTRTDIEEFSTSGFMGFKTTPNGVKMIIPDSENIIKSVTSDSCIEIGKTFGWEIEVRQIKYVELPSFDEIVAVGTAAVLVPVRSITRPSTTEKFVYDTINGPGPCGTRLLSTLQDIQRGRTLDLFGWNDMLYETVEVDTAAKD